MPPEYWTVRAASYREALSRCPIRKCGNLPRQQAGEDSQGWRKTQGR
jgi:hypothetical protein